MGSGLGALLLAFVVVAAPGAQSPSEPAATGAIHEGVASCGGSTCHGRQVDSGLVVRQNEISTWQDASSVAGAHSRAWRVLTLPRAQAIARHMGLGPAEQAPDCLGCHADPGAAGRRGERFQISDGVGCEACHGGSGGWLASHYTLRGSHAANVAAGMIPLDRPRVRADVCLDCHFGSARPGQFVSHRMMSAGHPRVSFELDLFTELQRHHDTDGDYRARGKVSAGGVKTWALGQALALERALSLYSDARLGQEGSFPEFYFFDCHSCHRAISDEPKAQPSMASNPARPIPRGMPPFNDENMILLSAAAQVAAPRLAEKFEADSRAFHAGLATDRPSAVLAAGRLAETAQALAAAFEATSFSRAQTFAILDQVLGDSLGRRFTDYEGGVQAVMAIDTLLNAMAGAGQVDGAAVAAIRPDINSAYYAVRDPNAYRQADFRAALGRIDAAVGRLR